MQGITNSLRIAVSGLQLAQDSLATTSNNVANVNTEGYSRKRIDQEARVTGGFGSGVRELRISRDVDQFLELQLSQQTARLGKSDTIHAYAEDVQGLIFGNPSDDATGLAGSLDAFSAKLEAAAAKPEDGARRAAVVWGAEDLFGRLDAATDQVQVLRRDADRRISALVSDANTALASIHDLNMDIKRSREDAELLDQRDALVNDLSRMLNVRTYTHDDGAIAVFTEDGQPLLEYEPRVIGYTPASQVAREGGFGSMRIFDRNLIDPATGKPDPADWTKGKVLVGDGIRAALTPELEAKRAAALAIDPTDDQGFHAIAPTVRGGELGGLLEVRDRLLPELDDQLVELGRLLRYNLNAAHNAANTVPAPTALTGSRPLAELTPDADVLPTGVAYIQGFETADPSNEVTVAIDLAAVQTAAQALSAGAGDPDPSTAWPNYFAEALADDINAAFGGGEVAADGTTGPTFTLAAQAGWQLALAPGDGAIVQSDDAGHSFTFGLSHFLGLNDFADAEPGDPSSLSVRADLAAQPTLIASARLDTVPDGGGGFDGTLGGPGDSRGLGELAGALERGVLSVARGGLPAANVTVREYLSDVTSMQALHAETAERLARNDTVLHEELSFQKAGISGVNLDEEMAHLLELQQAYATAAQVMRAADEMLQELLNIKR